MLRWIFSKGKYGSLVSSPFPWQEIILLWCSVCFQDLAGICGNYKNTLIFLMWFLLNLYQCTSLQVPQGELHTGKGGRAAPDTRYVLKPWSGFKNVKRRESKQQLIYVLKESLRCEQSSTYVLFDHSLVLSNGYKLFPNNQFNAGQCRGQ